MKDSGENLSKKIIRMLVMMLILVTGITVAIISAINDNEEYKIDYLTDGWNICYGDINLSNTNIYSGLKKIKVEEI